MDEPEKDVVHGVLVCTKCDARLEYYVLFPEDLDKHSSAVNAEMLDHLTNDCRVPEGTHQLEKGKK
jgi:hypothetical protein